MTHLAVEGQVAASTQNQAKSAILFLYREVLAQELPWLDNVERAEQPQHLPVVLTQAEVQALLSRLTDRQWLIASLLYVRACVCWKSRACARRMSSLRARK